MPVKKAVRGGKVRVVEEATGHIAKTDKGKARDGGGWPNDESGHAHAAVQIKNINRNIRRRERTAAAAKPARKPRAAPKRTTKPKRSVRRR